jgi:HK97 family phage prohead protease
MPAATGDRRGPPDSRGNRAVDFSITPDSYDAEKHTVDVVMSMGSPVQRWFGIEQLSMDPKTVDLSRVVMGQCKVLDTHDGSTIGSIIGKVLTASIKSGELGGTLQFAQTTIGQEAEGMVARGELSGISIGYLVAVWRLIAMDDVGNETWEAAEWSLLEVSFCSTPADPNAGVRSAVTAIAPALTPEPEDPDMNRNLPAGAPAPAVVEPAPAPAVRAAEPAPAAIAAVPAVIDPAAVRMDAAETLTFAEDAATFGIPADQVRTMVTTMTPVDARGALLRAAGDRQRATSPNPAALSSVQITRDERDTARDLISSALLHRFRPKNELIAGAGDWRGMSLLEMGRANMEANGEKTRGLGRRELAGMMMSRASSTSDFPAILANVANKTLRQGYDSSPQTFKAWQRQVTASDFKPVNRVQLGGAPSFLLIPEGGEFKTGAVGDAKEVYSLATYGRRFAITRQALINDDLDAFTRLPEMMGRAAADFESDAAYVPLITNPNMGDGNAIFSSAHGNLAGSGGAIVQATVQAGEIAMSKQVGLEGRLINVRPAFMIVSSKNKVPGQQLLTAIQATATGNVNVYAAAFSLVVEPRLNRASGAEPWWLVADYNAVDTVEYAYLEGEDGVFLDERIGFEVDGMEFKARLDFATKAIDWRGMYQDPGV